MEDKSNNSESKMAVRSGGTFEDSIMFGNDMIEKLNFGNDRVDAAYFGDTKIYPAGSYKRKIVSIVGNNIIVFEDDLSYKIYSCPYGDILLGTVGGNYVYMYDINGYVYRTSDFLNWKEFNTAVPVNYSHIADIYSNGQNLLLLYAGASKPYLVDTNTNSKILLDNSISGSSCIINYFEYNKYLNHFVGYRKAGCFREYSNSGEVLVDHNVEIGNPCAGVSVYGRIGDGEFVFLDNKVYHIREGGVRFIAKERLGYVKGTNRKLATIYRDGTYTGIIEFNEDCSGHEFVYRRSSNAPLMQLACIDNTYLELARPQTSLPVTGSTSATIFRKILMGTETYESIEVSLINPARIDSRCTIDVMNVKL